VFTPERRAHGRTPDVEGPITFELMANDTIAFLETVVGDRAHLAGCSDGAIVALLVALLRPGLIRKLVFIAGSSTAMGGRPVSWTQTTPLLSFSSASMARCLRTAPSTTPSSSPNSRRCTLKDRR
jgi:pimeloyl-ACP methyl ester carboxylesterase